jgi:spore coat protein CotH
MNNVVTVRITMPPRDWETLRTAEPHGGICKFEYTGERYDWFKTTSVEISGSAFPSGGVHSFASVKIAKKSYCGSFSISKPALKLKFSSNEDAIEDLIGTQFITLNSCIQDPSYIRQPLGYFLFKQAVLPYSRCNFARVYVNDTNYGVYLNIEPIKKRYIQNNFNDNDKGNLYEIEEGEDLTPSIMAADRISFEGFSKYSNKKDLELATREISDNGLAGMEKVIDTNQFLRFFAMEALLKHWDGYTNKLNNTYVYNDVEAVETPTVADVKFKFIPWGLDRILQETEKFQLYDASVLGKLVLNDADRLAKLKTEIRNYANTIFGRDNYSNVLSPYIDQMQNILTSLGLTDLTSQIEVVREQLKLVNSGGFQLMGEFSPALV